MCGYNIKCRGLLILNTYNGYTRTTVGSNQIAEYEDGKLQGPCGVSGESMPLVNRDPASQGALVGRVRPRLHFLGSIWYSLLVTIPKDKDRILQSRWILRVI